MIFPGMDPYLENPERWPGVQSALVVYIRDQLRPLLRPRYVGAVEDRVYIEGREPYIEVLDFPNGQRVVTVIAVVSPANKSSGPSRNAYLKKQNEVLWSTARLVEIDLLRVGLHVLAVPERLVRGRAPYDYLICVRRLPRRPQPEVYPCRIRERLPRVGIPLANGDPDVPLDLQAALEQTYDSGDYRYRINYSRPCEPPLAPEDQEWANDLIRGQIKDDESP